MEWVSSQKEVHRILLNIPRKARGEILSLLFRSFRDVLQIVRYRPGFPFIGKVRMHPPINARFDKKLPRNWKNTVYRSVRNGKKERRINGGAGGSGAFNYLSPGDAFFLREGLLRLFPSEAEETGYQVKLFHSSDGSGIGAPFTDCVSGFREGELPLCCL